jgi:hypothetical protein
VVNVTREPAEMISEILDLCRTYLPTIGTFDNGDSQPHAVSSGMRLNALSVLAARGGLKTTEIPSKTIWIKEARGKSIISENVSNVEIINDGLIRIMEADGKVLTIQGVDSWGYGSEPSEATTVYRRKT